MWYVYVCDDSGTETEHKFDTKEQAKNYMDHFFKDPGPWEIHSIMISKESVMNNEV